MSLQDPLRLRSLARAMNFVRNRKSNHRSVAANHDDCEHHSSAVPSWFLSKRPNPLAVEIDSERPASVRSRHTKQRRSTLTHVPSTMAQPVIHDATDNVTNTCMPKNRLSELYCSRRRNRRSTMTHVPAQLDTEGAMKSNLEEFTQSSFQPVQSASDNTSIRCPRDIHVSERSARHCSPIRSPVSKQAKEKPMRAQHPMHRCDHAESAANGVSKPSETRLEIKVPPLTTSLVCAVPLERHLRHTRQQSHRRSTLSHLESTRHSDAHTLRSGGRSVQSLGTANTRSRPNPRIGRSTRRGASRSPQRSVRSRRTVSQSPQRSSRSYQMISGQSPQRTSRYAGNMNLVASDCSSGVSLNQNMEQHGRGCLDKYHGGNHALNTLTPQRKHRLQSRTQVPVEDSFPQESKIHPSAPNATPRHAMEMHSEHVIDELSMSRAVTMPRDDQQFYNHCVSSTSGKQLTKLSVSTTFSESPKDTQSPEKPQTATSEASQQDASTLLPQHDTTCAPVLGAQDDSVSLSRLQHRLHRSNASRKVATSSDTIGSLKIGGESELIRQARSPTKQRSSSNSRTIQRCRDNGYEWRSPPSTKKRSVSPSKRGHKASQRVALDSPSSTKSIDALTLSTVDDTISGSCGSISLSPEKQFDPHNGSAHVVAKSNRESASVSSKESRGRAPSSSGFHSNGRNLSPGAASRSSLRMLPVSQLLEQSSSSLMTSSAPVCINGIGCNTAFWEPVDFDMDDEDFFRRDDMPLQ